MQSAVIINSSRRMHEKQKNKVHIRHLEGELHLENWVLREDTLQEK